MSLVTYVIMESLRALDKPVCLLHSLFKVTGVMKTYVKVVWD